MRNENILRAPRELISRMEKASESAEYRNDFMRDRDRIMYCSAFRRLDGKTQIYLTGKNDHRRNRLTHTLEVAQIARTISQALDLDVDLTEAIALGHDLGHTPFGHAGEQILNEIMQP
ncbi:MAG TPA: HD domain-containing protein, partial [Candidatus Merdibacter merdigallinarum]|nr:HD domain-containing protein [Candidatus Merdibacter merdigallinarum]